MDWPDLTNAPRIGFDTETYDPNLEELGPGDIRGDGYVVGVSVATDEASWYFPLRHEGGDNVDIVGFRRWARDNLTTSVPKYGANVRYDIGWLQNGEEIPVSGPFVDVQIAEPLLDENALRYDLERLGQDYLGMGKVDAGLWEWLAERFGGKPNRKAQISKIRKAPAEVVAPYAKSDAELPLKIFDEQRKKLAEEGLLNLFDLESRLIPMLVAMRNRGVPINVARAEEVRETLNKKARDAQAKLNKMAGMEVNVWAPASLGPAFDAAGIEYPLTPKTKAPSFKKEWLAQHPSELAQAVQTVRRYDKVVRDFIDGHILGHQIDGRIHSQLNQLKGDDTGTVSGRFSSSDPNLQQIPSRDEELAPLIRSLFEPEEGEDWYGDDWSQIEFRLLTNYGRSSDAQKARQQYIEDPTTDFHQMTSDLVEAATGTRLGRKQTKNVNFGLVYGMGVAKLAGDLGLSTEEARELMDTYFGAVPFVKDTFRRAADRASKKGYITTILGRRRRFPVWEPKRWNYKRDGKPPVFQSLDAAKAAGFHPSRLRRAFTHKALNSLLQGGAADIMKLAMVQIWESGICDVLGAPLLTVHDELDWSVPRTKEAHEAHQEAVRIMTEGIHEYTGKHTDMLLPLKVDVEKGPNWGHVEEVA